MNVGKERNFIKNVEIRKQHLRKTIGSAVFVYIKTLATENYAPYHSLLKT